MCDYSLHALATRPAKVGETLISTTFRGTSTRGFALVRIVLALGESGTYPAALAAASEWFPRRERALAIGIFNAGANLGAIVTPMIVPLIALAMGWRGAFVITGLFNIVWLVAWLIFYRRPREHPTCRWPCPSPRRSPWKPSRDPRPYRSRR